MPNPAGKTVEHDASFALQSTVEFHVQVRLHSCNMRAVRLDDQHVGRLTRQGVRLREVPATGE